MLATTGVLGCQLPPYGRNAEAITNMLCPFVSCRSASRFNSPSVIWRSIPLNASRDKCDTARAETTDIFAPVVSPGLVAPAAVLLHHGSTVRLNGLAPLSEISATNSAGPEAMFHPPGSGPCTGGRPADLLLSHRTNLCNPELRRCGPFFWVQRFE